MQFTPGSDLALANGILHLLVKWNAIDRDFIDENVVFRRGVEDLAAIGYGCFDQQADGYQFTDQPRESSWEEFEKFLEEYAPARVAEISGVSESQLTSLAKVYADRRRE